MSHHHQNPTQPSRKSYSLVPRPSKNTIIFSKAQSFGSIPITIIIPTRTFEATETATGKLRSKHFAPTLSLSLQRVNCHRFFILIPSAGGGRAGLTCVLWITHPEQSESSRRGHLWFILEVFYQCWYIPTKSTWYCNRSARKPSHHWLPSQQSRQIWTTKLKGQQAHLPPSLQWMMEDCAGSNCPNQPDHQLVLCLTACGGSSGIHLVPQSPWSQGAPPYFDFQRFSALPITWPRPERNSS